MNELTFADGIKYLSDVDIEMKLRFSCQPLLLGAIVPIGMKYEL